MNNFSTFQKQMQGVKRMWLMGQMTKLEAKRAIYDLLIAALNKATTDNVPEDLKATYWNERNYE